MRFAFRKTTNRRKRQAGFTLIEGMIVTAIVLLLGGMLMMVLGNQPRSAEIAAARNDAAVLNSLIEGARTAGATVGAGGTNQVDITDVSTVIDSFDGSGVKVANKYSSVDELFRLPDGFDATLAASRLTLTGGIIESTVTP